MFGFPSGFTRARLRTTLHAATPNKYTLFPHHRTLLLNIDPPVDGSLPESLYKGNWIIIIFSIHLLYCTPGPKLALVNIQTATCDLLEILSIRHSGSQRGKSDVVPADRVCPPGTALSACFEIKGFCTAH